MSAFLLEKLENSNEPKAFRLFPQLQRGSEVHLEIVTPPLVPPVKKTQI